MTLERETVRDNSIYLLQDTTSLQACIGWKVNCLCADSIDLTYGEDSKHQGDSIYYLGGAVCLEFYSQEKLLTLHYDFRESSLGENAHVLNVQNDVTSSVAHPVRIRFPEFMTVERIEVWGVDYETSNDPISNEQREVERTITKEVFDGEDVEFSMTEPYEPFWQIEFDNPGKRIAQRVYDESILVFYFAEGEKMIMIPHYPSVQIRIEDFDKLSPWLQDANIRRKLEITERGIIPYDRPISE